MDPSVFGTGSIVLNKANAALNVAGSGSNTVPGYSNGGFHHSRTAWAGSSRQSLSPVELGLAHREPRRFPDGSELPQQLRRQHRVRGQLVSPLSPVRGTSVGRRREHAERRRAMVVYAAPGCEQ